MASGDTLLSFTALSNIPPSTDYATLDLRNYHPVLDFDGSTTEYASFEGVLPKNYAGSGITLTVGTMTTSATSGQFRLGFSFERHSGSFDLDTNLFTATQYLHITAVATAGVMIYASTSFANGSAISNIATGEHFRLLVCRDSANPNDDFSSDIELASLEMWET